MVRNCKVEDSVFHTASSNAGKSHGSSWLDLSSMAIAEDAVAAVTLLVGRDAGGCCCCSTR